MTETKTAPPVIRAAWVNRTVEDAFAIFTGEIGAWWPLPTHGLFGPQSGSVSFRDGLLVEQAIDGSQVTWAEVIEWDPPTRLVLAWHPGRTVDEASEVEVVFEAHAEGTRVVLEHRGWEAFGADAAERRLGYVGPNAWGYVLDHFGDGAELRPDPVDLSALEAAYATFYDEAAQGGFGPAPEGEWDAEQTVAHVVLNDAAMLGVCQALVHGTPPRFENEVSQDLAVLAEFIASAGGMDGLIEQGRHMAQLVSAAVRRLSADQRTAPVHCCLSHYGETMLDREMPWESIIVQTQADRHLPAHVEQLQNLRVG